ncbi:MAG: lysylphosphatidylglycerol synthase transmembrane domain-containing protein [Candidatus Pacearchaeota archaeon]
MIKKKKETKVEEKVEHKDAIIYKTYFGIKDWLSRELIKNKEHLIINLFLFLFIILIFLKFSEIREVGKLFWQVNWFWLGAALFSQFLAFFVFALHVKDVLSKVRVKIGSWFLTKIVIAMHFVDFVIPSQRIGGHIFLFKSLRKENIDKDKRSFSIIVSGIVNFGVDFIIFIFTTIYVFLFIESTIIKVLIAIFTGVFFLLYVPSVPFFLFLKGEEKVIWFFRKIPKKWLDKIITNFSERAEGVFRGYYNEKKNLRARDWLMPFFFMFLNRIFTYTSLFFVFFSLGSYVSIEKILIAEIVSAGVAFFSYIKIGFFEGALILALNALGINYNLAFTSTLLFRVINLWIPSFIGYLFFRNIVKMKVKKLEKNLKKREIGSKLKREK